MKVQKKNCQDTSIIRFAEEELCRYFEKMFQDDISENTEIILVLEAAGFRYDGYEVTEKARQKIQVRACTERGLLHGVYALLKELGCNFLFPGRQRERIPEHGSWPRFDRIAIRREPWLEYRGLCLYNTVKKTEQKTLDALDWMAKNGFNFLMSSIHREDDTGCGEYGHAILWDEIGKKMMPELKKRGIVLDMSEHSTNYYFPSEKLFEQHPEWFALVNGKRAPGQICYSNPNAVEAYGNALADFARENGGFEFMGIWPLDGGGYCECEKCSDPQTIFKANVKIAAKIRKVRPELTVEHLAYTPQSFARPKEKMPDNMCVLVCSVRDKIAYEWVLASKEAGGAFYFDYMTADHYRYRANVVMNPIYCREMVNMLAGYGFRGAVSLYLPVDCWFQASLNLWYLSELYYDPMQPLQKLHRKLALQLFGKEVLEEGGLVLKEIGESLSDGCLWSGYSHAYDWYCEHITGRSSELDRIHAERFDEVCGQILAVLSGMEADAGKEYQKNIVRMKQYVELQELYYHGVDLFDADRDTPERAEPYFKRLSELEKENDAPFISEEYARWRITGRDSIFDPEKTNQFQAQA